MNTAVTVFAYILIFTGLIGSVLPVIPGSALIFIGAFIYAWNSGFTVISWTVIFILLALALITQILDYLATMYGAKKFGAGKWGIAGALAGGIIGFITAGLIGIIIGPFIGAFLLEIVKGSSFSLSFKIGFGTIIGFIGGTVGKFVISFTMVLIFFWQVF